MNSTTQKIRIDSLNASHTPDGTLHVWGKCTFGFYERGEIKPAPLNFQSYGSCAAALTEAGVGAIVLGMGRLNINSVEKEGYKEKVASFTVTHAELLRSSGTPVRPVPAATRPVQPVPSASPQLAAIAGGNGDGNRQVVDLSDILF